MKQSSSNSLLLVLVGSNILLAVFLLGLFSWATSERSSIMNDIRNAENRIKWFEQVRSGATSNDVQTAAHCLYEVAVMQELADLPHSRHSNMEFFIERERKPTIDDIITILRNKTGDNMDGGADEWIEKYSMPSVLRN